VGLGDGWGTVIKMSFFPWNLSSNPRGAIRCARCGIVCGKRRKQTLGMNSPRGYLGRWGIQGMKTDQTPPGGMIPGVPLAVGSRFGNGPPSHGSGVARETQASHSGPAVEWLQDSQVDPMKENAYL